MNTITQLYKQAIGGIIDDYGGFSHQMPKGRMPHKTLFPDTRLDLTGSDWDEKYMDNLHHELDSKQKAIDDLKLSKLERGLGKPKPVSGVGKLLKSRAAKLALAGGLAVGGIYLGSRLLDK